MKRHVAAYYQARYIELWSQARPRAAPGLDPVAHDVGRPRHLRWLGELRHPATRRARSIRAFYREARECFALLPACGPAERAAGGLWRSARRPISAYAYRVGDVGIIVPDMRSDRTPTQVMNAANHAWFGQALDRFADCRQVLVMTSVPLLHADLSFFERFTLVERMLARLRALPQQRDDLIDQWRSIGHRDEGARLLRRLVDFAAATGARVRHALGRNSSGRARHRPRWRDHDRPAHLLGHREPAAAHI